jgi:hypothetical protein
MQVAPELQEDFTLVAHVERVELAVESWSQLTEKTDSLQQHIEAIQLQEHEQPNETCEKITQVVVEGDIVCSSLHS